MINAGEQAAAREKTLGYFNRAGIVLTDDEKENIEIADFGLNDLKNIGLELVVYINTAKVCAKELVLFPWQTCPEHRHPQINGRPGKEETFRCRSGLVYLYLEGEKNCSPQLHGLEKYQEHLKVAHEVVLRPGEQYTLPPDTKHWFRAGADGAVVSEFSTPSTDECDIFTDPRIERITKIE